MWRSGAGVNKKILHQLTKLKKGDQVGARCEADRVYFVSAAGRLKCFPDWGQGTVLGRPACVISEARSPRI